MLWLILLDRVSQTAACPIMSKEKRLDAIEDRQEMQNGAIDNLGAVTSALAEAVESGDGKMAGK